MIAVAEVPGKVIITGEHFVVHGAYALAAAINKRVRVEARVSDRLDLQSANYPNHSQGLSPIRRAVGEMYADRGKEPKILLKISSEIPRGSGLGSSASTLVACVAAAAKLEGWNLEAGTMIDYAMVGERMIHGTPSGIDVQVSTLGGAILFRKGEKPRRLTLARPTRFLIINSGMRRDTGTLIKRVSEVRSRYPNFFSRLCDAVSNMSKLAAERLERGEADELGMMMTGNHALLGRCGASNPLLDAIVDLCISSGCLGAKLTGAGGGGSVIAISGEDRADSALRAIRKEGYDCFSTLIPNEGVRAWLER